MKFWAHTYAVAPDQLGEKPAHDSGMRPRILLSGSFAPLTSSICITPTRARSDHRNGPVVPRQIHRSDGQTGWRHSFKLGASVRELQSYDYSAGHLGRYLDKGMLLVGARVSHHATESSTMNLLIRQGRVDAYGD